MAGKKSVDVVHEENELVRTYKEIPQYIVQGMECHENYLYKNYLWKAEFHPDISQRGECVS